MTVFDLISVQHVIGCTLQCQWKSGKLITNLEKGCQIPTFCHAFFHLMQMQQVACCISMRRDVGQYKMLRARWSSRNSHYKGGGWSIVVGQTPSPRKPWFVSREKPKSQWPFLIPNQVSTVRKTLSVAHRCWTVLSASEWDAEERVKAASVFVEYSGKQKRVQSSYTQRHQHACLLAGNCPGSDPLYSHMGSIWRYTDFVEGSWHKVCLMSGSADPNICVLAHSSSG